MTDKTVDLATRIMPLQQSLTYRLKTSNHLSNTIYTLDGKIIEISFLPPINLKQLRKIQKYESHLTTLTDDRKLPSQDAESDTPSQPTLFLSAKILHPLVINATLTFLFNTLSKIAQTTQTHPTQDRKSVV